MFNLVNIDAYLKVALHEQKYPKLLAKIKGAPTVLFYKGELNNSIFNKCLSVVGSRRMTSYGEKITKKIVAEVAAQGVTIVSGFMYGIDSTAHKSALSIDGKTIAVMPCGIDLICPAHQKELYHQIIKSGGLIMSEYDKGVGPRSWTFVKRNRIVAGLSQATLVVEAAENSGSLITANIAFKNNRKVFVIPASLSSKNSFGIVELLRRGAYPVTCAKDILKFYSINVSDNDKDAHNNQENLDSTSKDILKALAYEPLFKDDLSQKLGIEINLLNSTLTMLVLKGYIHEEEGQYHIS